MEQQGHGSGASGKEDLEDMGLYRLLDFRCDKRSSLAVG